MSAAAALEEAWCELRPRDNVERVDLIQFYSPIHRKLHLESYEQMVEQMARYWMSHPGHDTSRDLAHAGLKAIGITNPAKKGRK